MDLWLDLNLVNNLVVVLDIMLVVKLVIVKVLMLMVDELELMKVMTYNEQYQHSILYDNHALQNQYYFPLLDM